MSAAIKPAEAIDGEVLTPAWPTPEAAEAEAMAAEIIAVHDEPTEAMRDTVGKAVVVGSLLPWAKARWRSGWLNGLESNAPVSPLTAALYREYAAVRDMVDQGDDP